MKKILTFVLFCTIVLTIQCVSTFEQIEPYQEPDLYKMVTQTQIATERLEGSQKDETIVIEKPYIAFEEIIERSPNVQSVTRITDFKNTKEPSFFTLIPNTNEMVFQAIEEVGNSKVANLWKTSTVGVSGMTRLTAGRYYDMEPTVSRDGSSIYFSSTRSSNSPKIFKVSLRSASGLTRITNSQTQDRFPSFDAKTGRLFFNSRPTSEYEWQIWYVESNGSLPTQLKEGKWPTISPNGDRILYCSKDQGTGKWKLWSMNCDGTNQTQLTTDSDSDDIHPVWSPNGRLVVYSSNIGMDSNGRENYDIWIMASDGSHKTQLTTNGSTDFHPRVSPDNKYIYFLSNRGFSWDIWRMSVGRQ